MIAQLRERLAQGRPVAFTDQEQGPAWLDRHAGAAEAVTADRHAQTGHTATPALPGPDRAAPPTSAGTPWPLLFWKGSSVCQGEEQE